MMLLPTFHANVEWDLAPHLKEMGVRKVFEDVRGLFTIPGSFLNEVKPHVDIQVDQSGIRADAGTVVGAVYRGVMGGPIKPFSMELDRAFVYFVVRNSRRPSSANPPRARQTSTSWRGSDVTKRASRLIRSFSARSVSAFCCCRKESAAPGWNGGSMRVSGACTACRSKQMPVCDGRSCSRHSVRQGARCRSRTASSPPPLWCTA